MSLEVKDLVAKLDEATTQLGKMKSEHDAAIAKMASVESMDAIKKEVSEKTEQIKTLSEQLDALEAAGKIEMNGKKETVLQKLTKGFKDNENALNEMVNKSSASVNFDMKAASDIVSIANAYTGGTYGITEWDNEYARIPRRMPFLRQLVRVRPTTGMYVAWAEQLVSEGNAANTAESAAKAQVSMKYVEATSKVRKITAYMKTSKENLQDVAFAAAEINDELIYKINLQLDAGLLSGAGTGELLKGIQTYTTAFAVAGTILADAITSATEYDVIRAAVGLIASNGKGEFSPNYVLVNPLDMVLIDTLKGSNNHYVLPPFIAANGTTIAGVQVVENTGITAGTYLVGDFNKSVLAIREEVNINLGYENDDFTKNLVTVLGEMRATHYIKANHTGAFVKGTFATDKALLAV